MIYKQKVVENQCFIFDFCFIDLPLITMFY